MMIFYGYDFYEYDFYDLYSFMTEYTTTQRFGISKVFFRKERNTFVQQRCIKLIKSES